MDVLEPEAAHHVMTEIHHVQVMVTAALAPHQQVPGSYDTVYAVEVLVLNENVPGQVPIQVVGRHWLVTDSEGREQRGHATGLGGRCMVVGPGERGRYKSYCRIATHWGTMQNRLRLQPVLSTAMGSFGGQLRPFDLDLPRLLLQPPLGPEHRAAS